MEALRQWAFSICCAMVACGLAQILLPKSKMEKMFQLTVSVFFLCCLLSPVVLRNPQLGLEVREYTQQDIAQRAQRLTELVEGQTEQAAGSELEKIVVEKLLEKGINPYGVTIHISTNGQHGNQKSTAVVSLDQGYQSMEQEVRQYIGGELGMEVALEYR